MIKIEYPASSFRIKKEGGRQLIFDELRKLWLRLTPEEWVRQNFIQYLVHVKKYPTAFIAVEKEIRLGELKKRFDILVYNQGYLPWMMVECKEMNVEINQKVLEQILTYNIATPVRFMVITNGTYCVGYERQDDGVRLLHSLPEFTL